MQPGYDTEVVAVGPGDFHKFSVVEVLRGRRVHGDELGWRSGQGASWGAIGCFLRASGAFLGSADGRRKGGSAGRLYARRGAHAQDPKGGRGCILIGESGHDSHLGKVGSVTHQDEGARDRGFCSSPHLSLFHD